MGLILWERLFAQHRWRWRDLAAMASAVVLPWVIQTLWNRWLNNVYVPEAVLRGDWGHTRASQQLEFLHAHPSIIFPLLIHQVRDFFLSDDLMKGSWLSIFGAFGWSMFAMDRWAYWLLVLAGGLAFTVDCIANEPAPEQPRPSRNGIIAIVLAAGAVELSIIGVILGMYVYFSGAFLNRIGADEVIGVQGRYYHTAILLWTPMLLHAVRRRQPLGRWTRHLPAALVTLAMFACVLANIEALDTILTRFFGHYLSQVPIAPKHY